MFDTANTIFTGGHMDLRVGANDSVVSVRLKEDVRVDAAVTPDGSIAGLELLGIEGEVHVFTSIGGITSKPGLTIAMDGAAFTRIAEAMVTADPKRPAFTQREWQIISAALLHCAANDVQEVPADERELHELGARIEEAYS
jgi:hypothetical protein